MNDLAPNKTLKNLEAESISHFSDHGFLSPKRIIDEHAAATYRVKLEAYESDIGHPVQGPLRTKPHLLFKWVDDLMRHNTILDCIEDLIGPNILCWNSWFWIKEANTQSYVSWHQDSQYWGLDTDKLVTAWLALSPASMDSGCMRVIPGTHLGEGLQHKDLYHDDNMLTRGQEIVDIDTNKAVAMPLKTGEMSFHNVGIAHASGPNTSSDRRIGLSFHYMPTSTRQLNADWDSACLVRGVDEYGHFEQSPAPRYDLDPVSVAYHDKATTAMRELLFKDADHVRPTI
jgi:non-haem Fe2+, alpha-ketoglutarate-dependent halogenase